MASQEVIVCRENTLHSNGKRFLVQSVVIELVMLKPRSFCELIFMLGVVTDLCRGSFEVNIL